MFSLAGTYRAGAVDRKFQQIRQ